MCYIIIYDLCFFYRSLQSTTLLVPGSTNQSTKYNIAIYYVGINDSIASGIHRNLTQNLAYYLQIILLCSI